jgi:hypothetical protein
MVEDPVEPSHISVAGEVSGVDDLKQTKNQMSAECAQDALIQDEEQLHKGMALLEEACNEHPERLLACVKLWQFYRTLSTFQGFEETSQERALDIGERVQFQLEHLKQANEQETKRSTRPTGKRKLYASTTEARIIVALMNIRSLFDLGHFKDCFELLQYEFLQNSKHTGFLYLFGKYVIKANTLHVDENSCEQRGFYGSGIGALEECLKTSRPELLSRVNYYIGLAYNDKRTELPQPLRAVQFWENAK